jgi:DNA replication protein DnaC
MRIMSRGSVSADARIRLKFEGTPINETLVRDLADGRFLVQQRNAVLVGGTGTGKTHTASWASHGVEP